jgi:hypothetical protein
MSSPDLSNSAVDQPRRSVPHGVVVPRPPFRSDEVLLSTEEVNPVLVDLEHNHSRCLLRWRRWLELLIHVSRLELGTAGVEK